VGHWVQKQKEQSIFNRFWAAKIGQRKRKRPGWETPNGSSKGKRKGNDPAFLTTGAQEEKGLKT